MRFLADECVPQALINALRTQGRIVESMRGIAPGDSDEKVLARSVTSIAILISEDNDFGSLVFNGQANAFGLVLVRLSEFRDKVATFAPTLARRICDIEEELPGRMTIIGARGTRSRPLPKPNSSRSGFRASYSGTED